MKVKKNQIKVTPGQKKVIMPSGKVLSVPGGCRSQFFTPYQFNDTDAFKPEIWAMEAVRILYEEMIYPGTIHTDFNDEIARMGDVVHTRKPGELQTKRKQNDLDDLVDQDVTSTDILVKLNQRPYVSILIGDAEESLSMQSLIETYLVHEMQAQARFLDQVVGAQVYQFLDNVGGGLGTLDATNGHDYLLDTRQVMNDNKVTPDNRWLGLASPTETFLQKNTLFKEAQKIGDSGQALRNALLGRVAGFNTFLELNTPSVRNAATGTTTTMSNNETAGTTTFDVASGAALATGQYITIAGDNTPLRVTAIATNTITVNRPLRYNTAASAVVTPYTTCLVNQNSAIAAAKSHGAVANGYPTNWAKGIVYDGATAPKVGQLVSFKTSGGTVLSREYAVVQVNSGNEMVLDVPIENDIDDNTVICLGPNGDYNFAYQRAGSTLVNRAMKLPMGGAGARADQATFKNMTMSVKMSYDDVKEGHRVVATGLFGVKVLDTQYGAVMLG